MFSFLIHSVGKSFEYYFCLLKYFGWRDICNENQERLICWVLICQKFTVFVQMCTVLIWLWFSVFVALLMDHSRMSRRKIVRRSCTIWKDLGVWSINCKERAKHLFCDSSLENALFLLWRSQKHPFFVGTLWSEMNSLNIVYVLYLLKPGKVVERVLWEKIPD